MTTQEQLYWRRSKVLELLAQGFNQSQVAMELQLPRQTISDDVKVLREESKERIRSHLEERLPLAYDTCLQALMDTRKRAYEIVNNDKIEDPKVKLQAIQIVNDSTMKYMDIITHNETVKIVMSWSNKANKEIDNLERPKADSAQSNTIIEELDSSNDTERFAETSGDSTEEAAATSSINEPSN